MHQSERVRLSETPAFRLGSLRVHPASLDVVAADGSTRTLQPLVMKLMVALARAEGAVVSREALNQSCWDGRIVGNDALDRVAAKLRRLGIELEAFAVETIPRIGLRLVAGVAPGAAGEGREPPARDLAHLLPSVVVPEDRASIALMPLDHPGDPSEDGAFADGMVEEIATALSRYRSILVVAGGSTLALKGHALLPAEIGRLLGVRYLVDGLVRREGAQVRISLRLVEAMSGSQVWSDRFEGTTSNLFALQDDVAMRVAGVVEPAIQRAEIARSQARRATDMRAHDFYLRAWPLHRSYTREGTREGLRLVLEAVALDPGHGPALMLAAVCATLLDLYGWAEDVPVNRALGIDMARRAALSDENDAFVLAHCAFAIAHLERDERAAEALLDRAQALNPGCAAVWFMSGLVRVRLGDTDRAAAHLETAMRLDPIGPDRPNQIGLLSWARFQQRNFEQAVTLGMEFVRLKAHPRGYAFLAASLGHLGETLAAREALCRFQELAGQSIEEFAAAFILHDGNRALFLSGIAAARAGAPLRSVGAGPSAEAAANRPAAPRAR